MTLPRPPLAWACFLALSSSLAAQEAADGPPDLAEIARVGRGTADRMTRDSASWTAVTNLPGGAILSVDVLASPDGRRTVLSMPSGFFRRSEVLRIVERDGLWYVTEGGKSCKYRPYEAPFTLGTAYHFLAASNPQVVDETATLGSYEGTKDGVATYRSPLPDAQARQLRQAIAGAEQAGRQEPKALTPEVRKTVDQLRDLLERGVPVRVDLKTGLLVRFGVAERATEIRDFRWLDRVDPDAFRVDDREWEDFSDDPTAGDLGDLAMIGHAGTWRPGLKGQDTDGRLVDLKTGRYRRIPFQGSVVTPGCFLKGRTSVAVAGVDPFGGTIGLYEIDLKTGENRRLGGELLASGISFFPSLSPDGRTLVVLHKGPAERLLDTQACLVDLETGEARALGEARDQAFFNWLPDGQGFVFLAREGPADDLKAERKDVISRMDLEGRVEKIRDGDSPVLLDGRTVLFRDDASRAWRTCNLEGGDEKPYAGGLSEYGFPAPAPDGKRILMMKFRPGAAPEPTVLPIGGDAGKPALAVPGLWANPSWR